MMTRVSVIGLGKLGACVAACCAAKGHEVIGVDVQPRTVELVNAGHPPVVEPQLADVMREAKGRLRATTDCDEAVANTEISLIMVPTPSAPHGGFSLRYVRQAVRAIGQALRRKDGTHLIVVSSTVLPGSMEFGVRPVLEEASGRVVGEDVGLCYSPEFIALGSVIRDFLNPDFVLIGESDPAAGERLADLYASTCENRPPVKRMSLMNAELTKIAVNAFVTMKISFANMLASLCERLPGGDVDVVTAALGLDRRIGSRYLRGALGYGGPCFPRDNLALAYLARTVGEEAALAEATDATNRRLVARLVDQIGAAAPGRTVAVLGLAYKPLTNVVEESQGLELADQLARRSFRVIVYDPLAMVSARGVLGDRVEYAASAQDCVRDADVVVVTTPDPAFAEVDYVANSHLLVVDPWRVLRDRLGARPGITYLAVGLGAQATDGARALAAMWHGDGD